MDPFDLPLLNTLILLCSGTTVTWAHHCADPRRPRRPEEGPVADDPARPAVHPHPGLRICRTRRSPSASNTYGSAFYMATGFHGFHVIIGTIFLIVCLRARLQGPLHPAPALRLRGGGLVLALRRRGVAVPVRRRLRLGRLGRRDPLNMTRRVPLLPTLVRGGRGRYHDRARRLAGFVPQAPRRKRAIARYDPAQTMNSDVAVAGDGGGARPRALPPCPRSLRRVRSHRRCGGSLARGRGGLGPCRANVGSTAAELADIALGWSRARTGQLDGRRSGRVRRARGQDRCA